MVKEFNKNNGDKIDRHIFMKDIIDYLEVNIDVIKSKGRNGNKSCNHSCLPPVRVGSVDSMIMNTSPKKVRVSKNFC